MSPCPHVSQEQACPCRSLPGELAGAMLCRGHSPRSDRPPAEPGPWPPVLSKVGWALQPMGGKLLLCRLVGT